MMVGMFLLISLALSDRTFMRLDGHHIPSPAYNGTANQDIPGMPTYSDSCKSKCSAYPATSKPTESGVCLGACAAKEAGTAIPENYCDTACTAFSTLAPDCADACAAGLADDDGGSTGGGDSTDDGVSGDVKKCYEKCAKEFSAKDEPYGLSACKEACDGSEGKCPDKMSNSKCKDPDYEPEARRNAEDEKKINDRICDIICPKSIWWVFLIVGLVVVIAVVVILILVCFFKKLLCFGGSKASVAPSETVSVDTNGNSSD